MYGVGSVGGTEQSDAADDTVCRCDGCLQVDCCNSVATPRLAIHGTLVTSRVSAGRRVDGEHVNHRHHLVSILHSYTDSQITHKSDQLSGRPGNVENLTGNVMKC